MKNAKNDRQEMILKLIKDNEISTQEELTALMKEKGYQVTQATCSRDIKELGIIKVTLPNQNFKYAVLERTGDIAPGRLLSVFSNSLISCKSAMNLVVVKTLPGMAAAAASALDSLHLQDVVGTIAGDDTVFVATDSIEAASRTVKEHTAEAYSKLVDNIVAGKIAEGQFDNADISLREIETVKDVVKQYLAQVNHERISYANKNK